MLLWRKDAGITQEGFTTQTFYFDEVAGHPELEALEAEVEADLNLANLFDANCDSSGVMTFLHTAPIRITLMVL